ncbi:cytochrome c [Phenylobacterium sp.]|uniref:c-type cytochrome n=1 Tax=Phenylobacterium sp. TaxID=1871053 RepID=UPI002EDABBC7
MRTTVALIVAGLACAVALPAPASAQVQAPPQRPLTEGQSVALGRALVQRNCAMCHAVGRAGASPSPEAPPFRELHQRGDVEMLGEGGAKGILTRHPAMPEFRFQPHELVAIVRYLRSIQSRRDVRWAPRD